MTTKTINENSNKTVPKGKLMEDLRLVMADAEELLHAAGNLAGEGDAAARERIQKSLEAVKESLIDAEEAVTTGTQKAAKVADQYVHENPWRAIGISACVGAIIGMLIARR